MIILGHRSENFMYGYGNAGINLTSRANRRAYEKFCITPRMLVDSTIRDLSVSLYFVISQ